MTSLSRASASLGRDTRQLMLLRHSPEERHALLKAPGADEQAVLAPPVLSLKQLVGGRAYAREEGVVALFDPEP